MQHDPGTLVLRNDASIAMGTGHVMRCLALAQAWQDAGGKAVFAMAEATAAVEEWLRSEGMEVVRLPGAAGGQEDSHQTAQLAANLRAEWVVVDGNQFGAKYQSSLKSAGCRFLFVDDNGNAAHYSADIILDQNPHVPESAYQARDLHARLLLGSRYVLLRREFAAWLEWERNIPAAGRRILISMGGSDPDNLTLHALRDLALSGIDGLEITVVIGGSNPHGALLEKAAEESGSPVRLTRDARQIPEIMAGSDVAMIAGGGTLWEALFMRCAVLSYARNAVQMAIVEGLQADEAVISLGGGECVNPGRVGQVLQLLLQSQDWRQRLSRKGREVVDGRGARRVADVLMGREDCQ